MQHRAQQAGDRLQRGFALAGGERRAAHAFQQQSLAELDHWQRFVQPAGGSDVPCGRHPLARQQQRGLTRGLLPDDGAWAGGVD